MSKHQKTDVVINMQDFPFLTLTESKIGNVWYHDKADLLFALSSRGFRVIKGSKKILFKNGLGRGCRV